MSGNATLQQFFQAELQSSAGAVLPIQPISHRGSDGITGVFGERLITFCMMSVSTYLDFLYEERLASKLKLTGIHR